MDRTVLRITKYQQVTSKFTFVLFLLFYNACTFYSDNIINISDIGVSGDEICTEYYPGKAFCYQQCVERCNISSVDSISCKNPLSDSGNNIADVYFTCLCAYKNTTMYVVNSLKKLNDLLKDNKILDASIILENQVGKLRKTYVFVQKCTTGIKEAIYDCHKRLGPKENYN